jgi:hypothetical protein
MNPELAPFLPWLIAGGLLVGLVGTLAWWQTTRMRIKHGYPLEGTWGQKLMPAVSTEAMERIKLLSGENAQLRAELGSIKDRLANVERIVTDRGFDLTREIEALRDTSAGLVKPKGAIQ